ncbi:hypothetical protein VTK73DRAFT_10186 [Phialemonium thermophilum]|uniref:Uncharacterized protein n=1 Tax=Phialemonium thermophilum TaxID=223376 RepID=A0ABR3XH44_9PEZI
MPRFPGFARRKSAAENGENGAIAQPSFRVLDRSEVINHKQFEGPVRPAVRSHTFSKSSLSSIVVEDNMFADLKTNRGSGSSNTTKTTSTDDSSRHSNASTAPSSADSRGQDDSKNSSRNEHPLPSLPRSSTSTSFLKAAGRTFSFGGQKKQLPPMPPNDDPIPPVPPTDGFHMHEDTAGGGRARATTASTTTTVTPPSLESGFNLDLGGDFSKMLGFDKRSSVMTIREALAPLTPRSLTGGRSNQPTPIQIDKAANVDPPPRSWDSHHSNEGFLSSSPVQASPTNENAPPHIPRKPSPLSGPARRPSGSPDLKRSSAVYGRRASMAEDAEGEDARLLKDSLSAVSKFITGSSASASARYKRDDDSQGRNLGQQASQTTRSPLETTKEDDNIFDNSFAHSENAARPVNRPAVRKPVVSGQTKVMTPAQFEKYKMDKERQDTIASGHQSAEKSEDEEENYEDDEDDVEKAREQAKQRRKQEAHMAVYRQQMMKVTGESATPNLPSSRPGLQLSFSTPNLPNMTAAPSSAPSPVPNQSDGSDEDEEVPLAILAAHGFPNKNRPPTRLSTMASNPNLRAVQQPSYQRPASTIGDPSASGPSRLPAFAKNLPQDPFLGAGLINNPVRESFALGGGAPATTQAGAPLPPGGLIGVIASEERSRAMRRGSPHLDGHNVIPPSASAPFDPIAGIPPHMMYPNRPASTMLTPGDQAQIQMTQQMTQFMQMQMQFMQMMASQNGNAGSRPNSGIVAQATGNFDPMGGLGGMGAMGPLGPMGSISGMGGMPGMGMGLGPGPAESVRQSFLGNGSVLEQPRRDQHMRTMSMVQPSSSSWIQPAPNPGYAPSIRVQGAGYAPSIAPSERSNIGLPGRYRPVSHAPAAADPLPRSSTMPGALGGWNDKPQGKSATKKSGAASDDEDDDEEGWQAMKAKREKKRSLWKSKKGILGDIGALVT